MTPTLSGRLQTRVALMALVAVPLTLLLALLPGITLVGGLLTVLIMSVLGLGWELVYHALQQLRWDKDWPSLFGLLSGVPEGLGLWTVLGAFGTRPSAGTFALHVGLLWVAIWAIQQGPLKVIAPAWRFHGARLLERRPATTLLPAPTPAAVPTPVSAQVSESPLEGMFTNEREPKPERVRKPTPVRKSRPKNSSRPHKQLVFGRGARLAAAVTVAAVVGMLAVTNLGTNHRAPTAAVDKPSAIPSTPSSTPTPKPSSPPAHQEHKPQASQPVGWTVPSDHKAYKTWNKNASVVPYALTVPRLEMQTKLGAVGLSESGTLQTPKKSTEAGWYQQAAAPGQAGPGVIVGAMQGHHAIFAQLGELVKGDTVLVTRMDSTTIQFRVKKVQTVSVDQFPSQAVYGMTDDPQLRLIGFTPTKGKTKGKNVIVYGTAVQLLQPKQQS
ncbi:class F sortase [Nocardioides sp. KC13]|uniref:Class F sortase n=1 Tax=Nocardioides turkmenicus TaxID=2711220 RepID=A0A6M1R5Z8_9ACTN|nr:sortase [Nocardioides sp. KC13]NGN95072.1 class F sortase [Nocardioides sp. KC13]